MQHAPTALLRGRAWPRVAWCSLALPALLTQQPPPVAAGRAWRTALGRSSQRTAPNPTAACAARPPCSTQHSSMRARVRAGCARVPAWQAAAGPLGGPRLAAAGWLVAGLPPRMCRAARCVQCAAACAPLCCARVHLAKRHVLRHARNEATQGRGNARGASRHLRTQWAHTGAATCGPGSCGVAGAPSAAAPQAAAKQLLQPLPASTHAHTHAHTRARVTCGQRLLRCSDRRSGSYWMPISISSCGRSGVRDCSSMACAAQDARRPPSAGAMGTQCCSAEGRDGVGARLHSSPPRETPCNPAGSRLPHSACGQEHRKSSRGAHLQVVLLGRL